MSPLRSISKCSIAQLSRTTPLIPLSRSFHSPFNILSNKSPVTPQPPLAAFNLVYEKQMDASPQPTISHSGTLTYVVSEPDPLDKHYEVPIGAYPNTAPYQNISVSYQASESHPMNSDPAHPSLSNHASHTESEAGESAGVTFTQVPGEFGDRSGSYGASNKTDRDGPKFGRDDRNSGPSKSAKVSEKSARIGIK